MTAPLARLATDLAPVDEVFLARCEARALLHVNGYLSLHDAVDELQAYAEKSGLVDILGQDKVQDTMARALAAVDLLSGVVDLEDRNGVVDLEQGAADIMRRWELADARDRWKHTGEAPPASPTFQPARPPRCRTPQATVDAFMWLARHGEGTELDKWLEGHPRDAEYLCKLWKAKNVAA